MLDEGLLLNIILLCYVEGLNIKKKFSGCIAYLPAGTVILT